MNSSHRPFIIAAACALVLALGGQTFGQQAAPKAEVTDTFVTHTSFKSRIFEVKHRDPDSLLSVLRLLTSGHKGSSVSSNSTFKTITVRDFPENIASIEDALKRLDTPEAPRPDIELRMHVLLASNTEGLSGATPADLKDALTQLQSTLNFKNYQLLTTVVQRTKESLGRIPDYINGIGSVELPTPGRGNQTYSYNFSADRLSLVESSPNVSSVQLGNFSFNINGDGSSARIQSDVGIREGEKVVVGTSSLKDKALILVISAKLIK
ncbi:MAG: hypothetical protein H0T63_05215 [Pyrinomonadaceae bacterium]|nr:hypothetical protein [Pyrinomonadaceae bacterium]MDQ3586408.1 hypothetical protein [Acidobacteriota bacterium]